MLISVLLVFFVKFNILDIYRSFASGLFLTGLQGSLSAQAVTLFYRRSIVSQFEFCLPVLFMRIFNRSFCFSVYLNLPVS